MTATISSSTATSPAANPALAALSGTAATPPAESGTSAAGASGASGLFATLLQKQMHKPVGANASGTDPTLLLTSADSAEPDELETLGTELAALLPFLEAAGLVVKPMQTDKTATDLANDKSPAEATPVETTFSAATDPATGQLPSDTAALIPFAPVTAPPAAVDLLPQQAGGTAPLPAATMATTSASPTPPTNTPAGTAIIADGTVAAPLTDMPANGGGTSSQEGNTGGQSTFAALLATAHAAVQSGAATAGSTQNGEVSVIADTGAMAPAQNGQPNSAAMATQTSAPVIQHDTPPALSVAAPVGAAQWDREVGDKVVWMANRMESRADLVLTPPQMGRVEVSLTVNGDQASATFTSANPAVREALEAAMPRLREALAEAGIQLGQAQVGAENPNPSAQQEKNGDNFASGRDAENDAAPQQTTVGNPRVSDNSTMGRGLVDVFA